jgi:tetratricopeptide (TPR) repeat protein
MFRKVLTSRRSLVPFSPGVLCFFLLLSQRGAGSLLAVTGQAVANSPLSPAAIFRQGVEAMQKGQLAIAEDDFRTVIALDPHSGAAHVNLGVAYMRKKRWDDALVELRKAQALSPDQPGISLNIGLAYYRKNDFAGAIEPFTASLRQAPQSLQARYLLGLCYFFRNRYQQASETLAPLWDQESSNPNYLYVLSIAAGKSANVSLEKQAIDRMFAIGQNAPEFHLYIGKAWLAKGDTEKAIGEFSVAAAAKVNLPLVHYFLGRAYLQQHAYAKAEAELLKDAAIEPDFPYSYEDLGLLYAQLNQPEQAEHAFRQAIEHDHSLVNSYVGLAKLYRQQGKNSEALAMLDRAVALAPQSASVHYARGQALARVGRRANAHQEFDTSAMLLKTFNDQLQQDPSGDLAADAQDAAQQ